jgi:hypothetical protein
MVSIDAYNWSEAYKRSLAKRVRLNRAILTNKYWYLPVLDDRSEYVQVGSGVESSPSCGKWGGVKRCKNVEGHAGLSVDGVDATGKYVVRHVHWFCKNPLCPKCFARGWAVRRARSGEARLEEGVRRGLGKIEHFTVSPSVEDHALSEAELREKCGRALRARGIYGFCMLFHGRRMNKERNGLVWSPHYHVLGFLRGGYDKCRECKVRVCVRDSSGDNFDKCDGFEAVTRREHENDGYIVKVHEERQTVFGTLYYLFNHCTVRLSFLKRSHVVTWWGKCSNKQYSSSPLKSDVVCCLCGEDMEKDVYVGKRELVKDIGHVDYRSVFVFEPFDEDGEPNFMSDVESREYAVGSRVSREYG